jgi:hypothetical protein
LESSAEIAVVFEMLLLLVDGWADDDVDTAGVILPKFLWITISDQFKYFSIRI